MPQTVEAISHIKAAEVPIVVAINKMDKEDAQPDRVKTQLSEHGLQPVDWGGKTEMVPVSARAGTNIDALLETVLLEADIRDLKANKNRRATGVVIESALDRGRGAVATVLVQNGTLRVGDVVVVGGAFGRVRALIDDKGKQVKKAGPVDSGGDHGTLRRSLGRRHADGRQRRASRSRDCCQTQDDAPRRAYCNQQRAESHARDLHADGDRRREVAQPRHQGGRSRVGRSAALARRRSLDRRSQHPRDPRWCRRHHAQRRQPRQRLECGADRVQHPSRDEAVKRLAENEQVDLRFYQVIYDVENDLKKAMVGMLEPKFREVVLGRAEVREIFKVSKVGTIAGCYVQSGKLIRNAKVRVLRDSAVVFEGELESLRRFKDDVREVLENFECGVQVAKYSDLKQGDVIEAFTSELVAPEPVPA